MRSMQAITRPILAGLLAANLLSGCPTAGPTLRDRVTEGQQAFVRGDVLKAYRGLRAIDQTALATEEADLRSEYEQLLTQVTRATENLVERWLEIGGSYADRGNLIRALAYYDDLLARLPERGDLHNLLAEESAPLRDRLNQLRGELDGLVKEARRELGNGHTEQALQKLLEARWLADDNKLAFSLDYERLLEECDRRLPGYVEELTEAEAPAPGAAVPTEPTADRPKVRPRRFRRPRRAARPPAGKVSGPTAVQKTRIARMFARGRRLVKQGRKIAAIKTFRELLALAPDHIGAKAELKRLEPVRRKQIEAWMKKASEHFAREELDKAAPYYRKVLELEPDNLRAKEGWQMYQHLLELKKKQK